MTKGIIYLLVSGGMESVYMLWRMMRESEYEVRAHHIKLQTPQNRMAVELIAFNNCVKWLQDNIKPIKVTFSEYTHNFESYIPDYTIVTYTAYCLSKQPNVVAVAQGQSPMYDPTNKKYYSFVERKNHMIQLYKAANRNSRPDIPCIFPLLNISRDKMLAEMPRELFELTWSCRTPKQVTSQKWIGCGECDVCIPFKERGIPLNTIG